LLKLFSQNFSQLPFTLISSLGLYVTTDKGGSKNLRDEFFLYPEIAMAKNCIWGLTIDLKFVIMNLIRKNYLEIKPIIREV